MHAEFSWRNPRNKRAYRRPRRKWKDNITMTLYEMEKGAWIGWMWFRTGRGGRLLVVMNLLVP